MALEVVRLEEEEAEDDAPPPGWCVTSRESADWALAQVARAQAELAQVKRLEAEAIARVRARAEKLRAAAQRDVDFFSGHLRQWAEANREVLLAGGKKKSVGLINGSVGWRSRPRRLQSVDEAALLAWARQHAPAAVRVVESVDVGALEALVTLVPPPGAQWAGGDEAFVVKALKVEED